MMNDMQLAEAIVKGDKKAFQLFFLKYYKRLVAYLNAYTHNLTNAEDLAQAAFIRVWNTRRKLQKDTSPKSLLFAIAYRLFVDDYRKNKNNRISLDRLTAESLETKTEIEDELLERRIKKLNTLIDALPQRCKEILILNKIEGLKYREIADQLDISVKTVEAQMRIAFQKIREGFQEETFLMFLNIGKFYRRNNE